ncbi:hypothetical protein GGS21DRAFT_491211 [Xylaria nigripes]|nr:hypothetical protein GGS21DRAFT_491211 [Xylaria nigripes]
MLFQNLVRLIPLVILNKALAAPSFGPATVRSANTCYAAETTDLLCYKAPANKPQNVLVEDVKQIASKLRSFDAGHFYTMPAAQAPDCAEWTIYTMNSTKVTAKHVNKTADTSVLYSDIADTIDGGVGADASKAAAALISCGSDGGSMGVKYNPSNPSYNSTAYPHNFKPEGLLIKIVTAAIDITPGPQLSDEAIGPGRQELTTVISLVRRQQRSVLENNTNGVTRLSELLLIGRLIDPVTLLIHSYQQPTADVDIGRVRRISSVAGFSNSGSGRGRMCSSAGRPMGIDQPASMDGPLGLIFTHGREKLSKTWLVFCHVLSRSMLYNHRPTSKGV